MARPGIVRHEDDGVLCVVRPARGVLPLVFDSPHSGTRFPADFQPAVSAEAVLANSDLYVDRLFADAPLHGAVLLSAEFPRVYIDPNRAETDIDPADTPGWDGPSRPSEKTRFGKGLVWRRVKPGATPLYDRKLTAADVSARLDRYWRPYHATLAGLLDGAHAATGAVFHVNCHSMMPLSGVMDAEGPDIARPEIVLSDRDGETCGPDFLAAARKSLKAAGLEVSVNQPFKGAEIVRRHGRPAEGRHSLQIEINRKLYLNLQTLEPNRQFTETKKAVDRLIADLAAFVEDRTEG
jgi:N-formylglutamate deformylase